MSKASYGAPTKRKDTDEVADVNTPVTVDREDNTLLGIVRERYEYTEFDASARGIVENTDTIVNVATERVSIARGSNADDVRSLVEDDTNV